MKTLEEIIQKINTTEPETDIRIIRRMEIGSTNHQGDVYYTRVPANHPKGERIAGGSVQVALGSNMGARHMAEGLLTAYKGVKMPKGFKCPEGFDAAELCGPVVVANETWNLTHPEHAIHTCPPGVYQVSYQADMKTMRRVAD